MNFVEHGIYSVKVEEQTLLVDATGPFNEELIVQYETALQSCIKSLETANWNQIITLRQFSLFTPEAEKKLTQTLRDRRKRGLQACAVVLINVEGESLIKAQMSNCYNNADVKHNFFNQLDDAKKWLAAQ